MTVDHRTFALPPSGVRVLFAFHENEGLSMAMKHLDNLVGFFTGAVGNVNEIVHIWAHPMAAEPV